MLGQADLVILNSIDDPDASLTGALKQHQQGSGTLLIIPSSKGDINFYRSLIAGLSFVNSVSAGFLELDKPDFQNPFLKMYLKSVLHRWRCQKLSLSLNGEVTVLHY
ncbi:MAG: hypothetical protein WDN75_14430 [Bacteroidota bacterium]